MSRTNHLSGFRGQITEKWQVRPVPDRQRTDSGQGTTDDLSAPLPSFRERTGRTAPSRETLAAHPFRTRGGYAGVVTGVCP